MRSPLMLSTIFAVLSTTAFASADVLVVRERAESHSEYDRYHSGAEIAGFAGGGYGVGAGARMGGTFASGIYLGGAFTYYSGNASFLGGEVGYKFWPGYRWELRPYMFVGPAFVRVGNEGFGRRADQPDVVLGLQPGFLAALHFGAAYVSAEGRAYVAPNPGALALLAGVGVTL
jgi:hypothetical protein